MDLKEMGINTRDWVDSAQDRDYYSSCECDSEPPGSISHGNSQLVSTADLTLSSEPTSIFVCFVLLSFLNTV